MHLYTNIMNPYNPNKKMQRRKLFRNSNKFKAALRRNAWRTKYSEL